MKSRLALVLVLILLAAGFLALAGTTASDPLAPYRAPDGSLHIPGSAFTPALQHILFGGNELQPFLNLTYYGPARSPYPTAQLVAKGYLAPNPNVFTHPGRQPQTLAQGIARLVSAWFPPVDWGAQVRGLADRFFGFFLQDARAALTIDVTTTGVTAGPAIACTTTQTAAAGDNGILVILSEGGTTAYASVTYGSANLNLITGAAQNGGTSVRIEIWGFVGAVPSGPQTMTATLSGGTSRRQACATVLLAGVSATGAFINGTAASGSTANAGLTFSPAIARGNLGFTGLAIAGNTGPSAVQGTGAAATPLFGTGPALCTGGNAVCGAGADLPYPGTAITWTSPAAAWATAAVEVAQAACGSGGADCYRVGAGGTWNSPTNWSSFSGYTACNCTPSATDRVFFDANSSGTVTLSAATIVASLNMTGFTGALDTTSASSWSLRVNGGFTIQGTFLARSSTVTVTGNVAVLGVASAVDLGGSSWTINGTWTNGSTSAGWSAGTSTVTIQDGVSGTLTFGSLPVGTNEFNNLTLDASVSAGLTYTLGTNGLRVGAILLLQNSTAGATGPTILDSSPGNLPVAAGTLTVATQGALNSESSAITINGAVSISATSGYVTNAGGAWTVAGSWRNSSTSASWSFAAAITFSSGSAQTMTFAGSDLAGSEFNNVTFNSGTSAAAFTLATRGLTLGGTLTIGGGTAVTTLDTSASSLPVSAPVLNVIANGRLAANGSALAVRSMDTHLGDFAPGTSVVVVNASGGTVNVPQTVNNLTVNGGISTAFTGSLTWSGILTLANATVAFGANSLTSSGGATLSFASATITMGSGTWDTSSAVAFASAGSSVTFSGTGDLNPGTNASFAALTFNGGTRTLLGPLAVNGPFTLSGGILAKGTNTLAATAGITLSGGALTSVSGDVSVTGSVTVSAAASYIAFGSETWTVTGSWTNASTSASWSPGTATVVFDAASSQTMTFAALPGGAAEFSNITFNAGASTVTFTMAVNTLTWSGTLAVQGGGGTTTLATSDHGLNGGALAIGDGGALTANASAVSVGDVSLTGGTSGTLTVTTGAWSVSGNWDSSGAGAALALGTSTVSFVGNSTTIRVAGSQSFYNLTIAGTVTLASSVTATAALTLADGAVLTKTNRSITFNALSELGAGRIVDGSVQVTDLTVTNSDPTNLTTMSLFALWNLDSELNWSDASTVGTSTLTFTIGGNSGGSRFMVTKDGADYANGMVNASGQVVFTMLGSDPVVDVIIAAPCGGIRYWVGGAGNWSQTAHWSATSGGAGGCSVPNGTVAAYLDANAGAGTLSLDQNAMIASLDMTGWSGTLALGTFNLTINGNLTLAGGLLTIGDSAGTGLTVTGNLTVSGIAILDGSAGASSVSVAGNVSIASTTAYVRMGSGTWTFGGGYSNGSTSASWSPGTGTVVFTSATSRTMSFAAFAGNEFHNVTFASAANGGAVTFTMGTSPLRWSGALTIEDTAGSTTTLATADLALSGGSLTVGNSGVLTANASAVTIVDVTMTGGTSGTITLTTGIWTVGGNWDTSGAGSTFAKGTSTVNLAGAGRTLKLLDPSNGFHYLTVSGSLTENDPIDVTGTLTITGTLTTAGNAITGGAGLIISGGGALIGMSAAIAVSSVTMNDGSANTLSLTSGTFTVSGSWDTSGPASSFTAGTSTITLAAAGTIALGPGQRFATLIVSGTYASATQLAAATLTLPAGSLAKGARPMTVSGNLILSGGSVTSISGDVTIGGSVDVSSVSSFIGFGSETWTIGGAWTNASASASWSPGTGTVVFASSSPQTMTFAGTGLPNLEFNALVFDAGASTVTFTLLGSALRVQTLTVQGGTGITTVDTSSSGLPITAETLTVGAGGTLSAGSSTLTVRSMDTTAGGFTAGTSTVVVNGSGGLVRVPQALYSLTVTAGVTTTFVSGIRWSGALTLIGATVAAQGNLTAIGPAVLACSGATLTVSGSWDTSSAATFTAGGSTVTFTGAGQTISLRAGQEFAALVIAGSVAAATDLGVASLTVSAGGALTKTGHSITFNALTVNGTVVDGTVNVTGLTVTNDEGAARVTISVFSTWRVGSEYAWTHTSSTTGQASTWTIQGNPSGFLYHVTKDGSPFADGTVPSSGNVVVTMGGSDPNMRVALSAPPIPPWWQSPYFLGVLPLPFLMVVTMFVQRRRWRPTKAFLVDERGQLLREFALDPSCDVTYDQALQAGALDAVDKDVRVAKYNARAVRGDMLSLIVLAVGPADIEEAEFARGLLVSIQDKLEDSTKQRVDKARKEEAQLEAARAQTERGQADLHIRSQVFGEMANAFTIARGRVDADSEKLHALDADLREREERLDADRKTVTKRLAELERKHVAADRTASDLDSKHVILRSAEQAIQEREAVLAPKEKELAHRMADASEKASDLTKKEEALTLAQAKLASDLKDYHAEVEKAHAFQAELEEEHKALDELSVQMNTQAQELDARTTAVEAREKDAAATEESCRAKLADLENRERMLETQTSEVQLRELALREKWDEVSARETEAHAGLEDVRTRETALDVRTQELARERDGLDKLGSRLDEQAKDLDARSVAVGAREKESAAAAGTLQTNLADLEGRERALGARAHDVDAKEAILLAKEEDLSTLERTLLTRQDEMKTREAALATRSQELDEERKALDDLSQDADKAQKALQLREIALATREAEVSRKAQELTTRDEALGPREAAVRRTQEDFAAREKTLADERTALQSRQDLVAAKAVEIQQREEQLQEREASLAQEKIFLRDAKDAVEARRQELAANEARFAGDVERREMELRSQEQTLGTARVQLTKDTHAFEAARDEKNEWIASKEIELEAKEQGLTDREAEIRTQGEEVARRLSEVASREETLEIEADKLEKARAHDLAQRAEIAALSRDLEAKTTKFREEEDRKGGELRTWQATLESEQGLLKEQKDTFEKEMQELRESWAGRMIRVEQREEEIQAREAKVQTDVDWVGRNEVEISKREMQAADTLRAASELKAEAERTRQELEQRAMEIESRDRALREEAAAQAIDLQRRTEGVETQVAELAGRKAQWERELVTQTQKLSEREKEIDAHARALDAHEADLASREAALQDHQVTLRTEEDRLDRERADLVATEQQIEARQLELVQGRERLEADTQRLRTETDAGRQSLAAKEADLTSERERLERESSSLQDTLGAKAKEMAVREKAVAAHEEELRSEEHDIGARLREIENRERQAEARDAEIRARERGLAQSEMEQRNRRTAFDETVRRFEAESVARQKEWNDVQANLKSQEAQLAASAQNRQAEIQKRMEELGRREQSLNAALTQAQLDRTNAEAQVKAQNAKQTQIDDAVSRADRRLTDLKRMEDELLKTRQAFESEKLAWATRRNEELKQLEATREAAAVQTQQSERLIEDAQRRTYVAAEAEKAAKRQAEELVAAQYALDRRRIDAEKAEKDLAVQTAQLRDASQALGAKELELGSRVKELDALQARLAEMERKGTQTTEALKGRKVSLDQEAERVATLAAQAEKRQAEIESRNAAVEGKLADVSKREQILSTELQRADNLMEDLNRKGAELVTREKALAARNEELAKHERTLAERDAKLQEGMQTLERLRREQEAIAVRTEKDNRDATAAMEEADRAHTEAEKLKAQADVMQAEVAKNMRFLQKKALDVLDREEKLRAREAKVDEQNHLLESRAQILEQKDRVFDTEKSDLSERLGRLKQENDKLRAKLAEAQKASESTIDMDEWKRDIENRVKIIQKKALDLLDREERLRKREEELKALAAKVGLEVPP